MKELQSGLSHHLLLLKGLELAWGWGSSSSRARAQQQPISHKGRRVRPKLASRIRAAWLLENSHSGLENIGGAWCLQVIVQNHYLTWQSVGQKVLPLPNSVRAFNRYCRTQYSPNTSQHFSSPAPFLSRSWYRACAQFCLSSSSYHQSGASGWSLSWCREERICGKVLLSCFVII